MKGYVMGKSIKVMTEEASMRRVESGKSMSPSACVMKRCFDMAGSLLGILVLSPVFVVIYLLIKWEDGGTAISSGWPCVLRTVGLPSSPSSEWATGDVTSHSISSAP